jgi:hypothetical protein
MRARAIATRLVPVVTALAAALSLGVTSAVPAAGDDPASPGYQARDARNIVDAYGRIHGPGGQLRNPAYVPALVADSTRTGVDQLLQQVAEPGRLALTPGNVFPGWNVGNPLRSDWAGERGRVRPVAFTNRHGALLRGHVWRPLRGARDPSPASSSRPGPCRARRGCTSGSRRTSPSAATSC